MNAENVDRENVDVLEGTGNIDNNRLAERDNVNNEGGDRLAEDVSAQAASSIHKSEALKQIQNTNHEQFNQIAKLKKDLEYWQQKCLKESIERKSVEYDLKKARKIRGGHAKENVVMKDQIEQLQKQVRDQEAALNDLKTKYHEAKTQNEEFKKQQKEKEDSSQDASKVEQEVIERVLALSDFNIMSRIVYSLQAQIQQKYYAYIINQQKAAAGMPSNGVYSTGDQNSSSGMMFNPMMGSMQYMGMGGYPEGPSTQSNLNNASSSTSNK